MMTTWIPTGAGLVPLRIGCPLNPTHVGEISGLIYRNAKRLLTWRGFVQRPPQMVAWTLSCGCRVEAEQFELRFTVGEPSRFVARPDTP